MASIVIVDYGIGNLASVLNMFKKIGVKEVVVSGNAEIISKANKILLPGVGAFDAGMNNLEKSGLIPLLNQKATVEKIPVLGICLGMQMLTKKSEEGIKPGLGWIDAETVKFNLDPALKLKVPHMGWNYIKVNRENPLLDNVSKNRFYFVHSYFVKCIDKSQSLATSNFGTDFTCMVNKNNIFGVQFHPEKSLKFGMKVLQNFGRL
jgi:imidazole glycerol-phosphate synthase subunit HisH